MLRFGLWLSLISYSRHGCERMLVQQLMHSVKKTFGFARRYHHHCPSFPVHAQSRTQLSLLWVELFSEASY